MAISTTRAVDEAIGSMRDSVTRLGPACAKHLLGQRAKRPYLPFQASRPPARPRPCPRVLPVCCPASIYPPMGRLSAAQGIVQCGRGPCVHVSMCGAVPPTSLDGSVAAERRGYLAMLGCPDPPTCARLAHRGCGKDR
jgi:hypothetical protein